MKPDVEKRCDVIGLGEILWDCFPDRRLPGGAPANVAFHAQQLGLQSAVATRVGNDELGTELCRFLESKGLATNLVQRDPQHATGTVAVEPQAGGTNYTFLENSAWDFLEVTDDWRSAVKHARAICFGTLAQRSETSRRTIHAMLSAVSDDCHVVYDVNLRPPFFERDWIDASWKKSRIAKLNEDEVRVLTALFSTGTHGDVEFARWLLETYGIELVCITRGGQGALAVTAEEICEVSGVPITVVDTVGAGDSFTAALIWSRLQKWPLDRSLQLANRVGGLVASHAGAMPALAHEFRQLVAELSS